MIDYQPQSLLRHFGIKQRGAYRGQLHEDYIQQIIDAIEANQMVAIVGKYGQGKTVLGEFVAHDIEQRMKMQPSSQVTFVYINSQNLEKLNIAGVLAAIVWDLSTEAPKGNGEARARQATRLLGVRYVNSAKRQKTCLVIENAHRLSIPTLMQLKDFWESKYLGVAPLLSLVLIGQPELIEKLSVRKEVFWRYEVLDLSTDNGWMNFDEKVAYLEAVFGSAIEATARRRIAQKAHGPLHMEKLVTEVMRNAKVAGKTKVDEECIPISDLERMQALGLSYRQFAKEAGLAVSSVEDVLKGRTSDEDNARRVAETLARLENLRKTGTA